MQNLRRSGVIGAKRARPLPSAGSLFIYFNLDYENMRDSEGNRFELANAFSNTNEIEFVAVGQAGKGGYLTYDESGKYTSWSGLVPIR